MVPVPGLQGAPLALPAAGGYNANQISRHSCPRTCCHVDANPRSPPDALRAELKRRGLDGFVIPISDEHMSEYVGAYAQRLAWLTGFGGSAGTAVVLADKAAIFVDGRYTIQVREQVDGRLYEYQSVPQTSPAAWLGQNAAPGARSAMTPGSMPNPGPMAWPRRWRQSRPRWWRWTAIRSTPCGRIGLPRPCCRPCPMPRNTPGRAWLKSAPPWRNGWQTMAPMPPW
jgi:hypothetical protein